MKNLIYLFACIILMASCDKDLDDQDVSLDGKWILTDVQCYCTKMGITKNTLTFNTADSTATFVNNEAADENVWIRSGKYDFSINNDSLKLIGSFDNEPAKSSGHLGSIYSIKGHILTLAFDPLPNFIDDEFALIYSKGVF